MNPLFLNEISKKVKQFGTSGINAQQEVEKMRRNGTITEQQFKELSQQATQILKMLSGNAWLTHDIKR